MPIRSRLNQYRGVNAHLHSIFQNGEGWESFHSRHINAIATALNNDLPRGYMVNLEQSFETAPDMTYVAVVIHQVTEKGRIGGPITRIELLSPTKKKGYGRSDCAQKRNDALSDGIRLVEIDYLHQTPTPIKDGPRSVGRDPQSAAYNITISNPQPSLSTGKAITYFFGVDQAIPTLAIPLAGEESVPLDFGAVYDQTFRSLKIFGYQVDYGELPPNFETYTPDDQTRIQQLMERLRVAVAQGIDIDALRLSDVVE